jgi:hypothetical protein
MYKTLAISIGLYLFLEILCHGFAFFAGKIVSKADKQKLNHPLHLEFTANFLSHHVTGQHCIDEPFLY